MRRGCWVRRLHRCLGCCGGGLVDLNALVPRKRLAGSLIHSGGFFVCPGNTITILDTMDVITLERDLNPTNFEIEGLGFVIKVSYYTTKRRHLLFLCC